MDADGTVIKITSVTRPSSETVRAHTLDNAKPPDKVFKEFHLPRFYIYTLTLSMVTFVLDLFLHCKIAYIYSTTHQPLYFVLTLVFIVTPALVTTAFSMRWYIHDEDEVTTGKRPRLWRWALRLVMLALQLAPLMRYIDALSYGVRSNIAKRQGNNLKHQEYLRLMLEEELNASHLRLFPCFLQSSPQAIIQLVFLLSQNRPPAFDPYLGYMAYSVACSVISIAWALTAYHKAHRATREDKDKLSVSSSIMMFGWYFFITLSRILALSLLATLYPSWFGALCLAHWSIMSTWLVLGHNQTAVCASRCEELILGSALGLAYVVAFISPKDGPTRYSYLAYYLICFIENTTALVVWCITSNIGNILKFGAVGVQLTSFLVGLVFMVSYYKYCHPAGGASTIIRKTLTLQPGKSASL